MPWTYDEQRHRYRDVATGRLLSVTASIEIRDDFIRRMTDGVVLATRALARGLVPLAEWEGRVLGQLTRLHTAAFLFGRGGRNAITARDKAAVRQIVAGQAEYLRGFARDVASGGLSGPQMEARVSQYVRATAGTVEAGKVASYRDLSLPVMPGDGGSVCGANCACTWSIVETAAEWRCTWTLNAQESCPDCRERAARYAPLVIAR